MERERNVQTDPQSEDKMERERGTLRQIHSQHKMQRERNVQTDPQSQDKMERERGRQS